MFALTDPKAAEDQFPRRLLSYAPGLWQPGRVRRILEHSGFVPIPAQIAALRPKADDCVGVWGHNPRAPLGEELAASRKLPLVRIEDAFLRSIHPGRAEKLHDRLRRRNGPIGLLIDDTGGVHFDAARPSKLETLLARHPLDDAALLTRARDGMARIAQGCLSKYNAHDVTLPAPPPGYVLIVDQTLLRI